MQKKVSLQESIVSTAPTSVSDVQRPAEVMRYAQWLVAEAKRNNNGSHQEESRKYAEDALRSVMVNGKEFRPFAPFRYALSACRNSDA